MKELNEIGEKGLELIRDEWDKQGHDLSGEFKRSLYFEMEVGETIKYKFLDGTERNYGAILNRGVTADKVPYQRGSGKKTSAYIDGLRNYVEQRMGITEEPEKTSIAFAIANTHIKEGYATTLGDKKKYTKTDKRKHFAEDGMKEIEPILQEMFFKIVENGFK